MFSVMQKRDISDAVQKILRATRHPELPEVDEIPFLLHVDGAESWSFADIRNNGAVPDGTAGINPHNELMASIPEEQGRGLIEDAKKLGQTSVASNEDVVTKVESVPLPDPRATPDEFMKEMLTRQLAEVESRLLKLESYFKEIMEDNLIQHHDDQIRNLMTAVSQFSAPGGVEKGDGQ